MPEKSVPTKAIGDGVYLINEFDGTNCYLVVGSEKALLIDCGTGFCDLRAAAEQLTDKPILLVATHGHVDHVGGADQFESLYLHKADCNMLCRLQMTLTARRMFVATNDDIRANGFSWRNVKRGEYKPKIIPIEDGFTFDLGGRSVTVRHTPGHSKGSIALIDSKERFVFSGDNVCDALWMHLPGSTSLEAWLPSARWLFEMSESHRVFWAHRTPELTRKYIARVISWGEEILASQKKNTLFPKTKQYPARPDGIYYRTNRVHK